MLGKAGFATVQTDGARRRKRGLRSLIPIAMETLLSQAEQLPGLLAASRSGLVSGWDGATVQRALGWGRFFQQLHGRMHCQPGLRAALERRLCRRRRLSLGHLRRCPELLALALLENRALPAAAYQRLLRGLLMPGAPDDGDFVALLARRRAACQLLCLHPAPPPDGHRPTPQLRAQAQLLLARLQEEEEGGGGGGPSRPALLAQLPCGAPLCRVVAAALLEPRREAEAAALLLPWVLRGDPARLAAFCRLLPAAWMAALCHRHPELRAHYFGLLAAWGSRLRYDPLRGEWRAGRPEEDRVPWPELRERLGCLLQQPEPLRSAARTQLSRLKAQDGDFDVPGLSVWTDLLLALQATAADHKPSPRLM